MALRASARRFEPATLLRLVQRMFPDRPVLLRSKRSSSPEPSPVESLEVLGDQVVLTLNFGMRSSTSPLPSYLQEMEADPLIGQPLEALLGAIDAGLLRARLEATDPGESEWLAGDPRALARDLRAVARLSSPSGLWWLFSRVFPELEVTVRRGVLGVTLTAEDARVGFARLGSATLGGSTPAPLPGFDAVLRITPADTWTDGDWPREVAARLADRVFPALRGTEILLRVWLVDPRGGAALALGGGRVGVDALKIARSPGVSLLFEGAAPGGGDADPG